MYDFLRREYFDLNLSHTPEIVQVASASEALELLKHDKRFDLVITTAHSADMGVASFARKAKKINKDLPIVHLVFDTSEFNPRLRKSAQKSFDRIFTWNGDFRIIVSIIKVIEDERNVRGDVDWAGVQIILLVEDNIRFYSAYLPLLYSELLRQSQTLAHQGINLHHKFLKMRARPKILLATNYEEACTYFDDYEEHILGVISDVNYMHSGTRDESAGLHFTRYIRSKKKDIPILLQSHDDKNREKAQVLGTSFLNKDSKRLLQRMRAFVFDYLGFGDFIFRKENGEIIGRASDLASLREMIENIPAESLHYHADRNHISNWLKARREFWLAYKLRPAKISDYENIDELREHLISVMDLYTSMRSKGILTDFNRASFDPEFGFSKIGTGSIGGKARGLSFLNLLVSINGLFDKFENVHIKVPSAVVLGTDVFDSFMNENDLYTFALDSQDDDNIIASFLQASFPPDIIEQLQAYLEIEQRPIAIRSSSLLEDSQYFPFAGIFHTVMLANTQKTTAARLAKLVEAIKLVFASTYTSRARNYMKHTSFRLEEERMAVVIQHLVGNDYGERFYPDISGVAKSYNYYVVPPQKSEDGVASIAVGFGKTVVEGGKTLNFCPAYPRHIPQLATIDQALYNNQVDFFAVDMHAISRRTADGIRTYPLHVADSDGSLRYSASTYSHDNAAIYDGVSRIGQRIVTLAPILKQEIFPLPEIIDTILKLGKAGMANDIEIEFAMRLSQDPTQPHEFCLLQMRPVAHKNIEIEVNYSREDTSNVLCYSDQVLGNGHIQKIKDIIFIDYETFERAKSTVAAEEIKHFNKLMARSRRPYLLVTLGRLGSNDHWLGVPVHWEQIAGAKAIIESGMKDIQVEPSQASHFFQNVCSFKVGYFTVNPANKNHFLNWKWLTEHPIKSKLQFVKHVELNKALDIRICGKKDEGLITFS